MNLCVHCVFVACLGYEKLLYTVPVMSCYASLATISWALPWLMAVAATSATEEAVASRTIMSALEGWWRRAEKDSKDLGRRNCCRRPWGVCACVYVCVCVCVCVCRGGG